MDTKHGPRLVVSLTSGPCGTALATSPWSPGSGAALQTGVCGGGASGMWNEVGVEELVEVE